MAEIANEVPKLKAELKEIAKNEKLEQWFDFDFKTEDDEFNIENNLLD